MRMVRFKKMKVVFLFFFICILFILTSYQKRDDFSFSSSFRNYFSVHSEKLSADVLLLFNELKKRDFNSDSAKVLLSRARMEYKAIEPFVITYLPGDARILNKVIIVEMEDDDEIGSYIIPHGFQYIEKLLYSDSVVYLRKKLKEEVELLYSVVVNLNVSVSYLDIHERDVFEAMQMHLVRQFMLGFANFETSYSRTALAESAATISYYKEFFQRTFPYPDEHHVNVFNDLYLTIDSAVQYLNKFKSGTEPDYFSFYSGYYIPLSDRLDQMRKLFTSNNIYNTTAINYQIRSVFDSGAFNSNFFLKPAKPTSRNAVVELGHTLFFDPVLSANNLRACASCHRSDKAFTDGLALSQSFEPGKNLNRNAPTILNSVLQRKLFHDGRVFTYEDQAGQVMSNPLEMHNDFGAVAEKLKTSPEYVNRFRKAFIFSSDSIISSRSILLALAEYERSLISLNSNFDKTVSGRELLLNFDEKEGFNIYMGKANCASCHFIPLFNGVMPPEYVDTEWEIIGVPAAKLNVKNTLDPDPGRAGVIDVEIFRHAFKVPTLRNIELTGPYMHNGVFNTLEEVIEFYDIGGGVGLGYDVPFQTMSSDSLHLTATEKFQLISFLKTLTDTVGLTRLPVSLPNFPDQPKLNNRLIGGEY